MFVRDITARLALSSAAINTVFPMTGDVMVKRTATTELMKKTAPRVLVQTRSSGVTPGVASTMTGSVMVRMTVTMRQTSVTVLEDRAEAANSPVAMVIVYERVEV